MTSLDNPACPVVENEKQARALGAALAAVWHFDALWVLKVFQGDPSINFNTGPEVINNEIASRWNDFSTLDERRRIVAIYMERMLS